MQWSRWDWILAIREPIKIFTWNEAEAWNSSGIYGKPDIIILDEPINALDEAGAKQVHKILEEQKKRGALIIIACHDKEELEMLSDEIIEIYEGRIVAGEKE